MMTVKIAGLMSSANPQRMQDKMNTTQSSGLSNRSQLKDSVSSNLASPASMNFSIMKFKRVL